MVKEIFIEVDLGLNAVEKRNIFVYLDNKMESSFFDAAYEDIYTIAGEFQKKYPNARLEVSCLGEDCCGRYHQWKLDINKKVI